MSELLHSQGLANTMLRVPKMRQARYWICTIPRASWTPQLPNGADWCLGQPEIGEGGYQHWQLIVSFPRKVTLGQLKSKFGFDGFHAEPTRSVAAEAYVTKEDTRDGEIFEFGSKAINRNSAKDWKRIKELAQAGRLN